MSNGRAERAEASEAEARAKIAEQLIEIARLQEKIKEEQRGWAWQKIAEVNMELLVVVERERDIANARAETHLADAHSMRNQRDTIHAEAKAWKESAEVRLAACRHLESERDAALAERDRMRAVIDAAKALRDRQEIEVVTDPRVLAFDAALAALEGDK